MPFAYPVSLELTGRRAVVVGADAVAMGKVESLLEAGADVTVVAERPRRKLDELEAAGTVEVWRREYVPGDLDGAFVCVASSGDPEVREAVFAEARSRGVLVNVMDDPARCDFAAPAIVRRGDLTIAVATGGRSPALASRLREELSRQFGPEWREVVSLLGEVRQETLPDLPDLTERSRRWKAALRPDEVAEMVREGRHDDARAMLIARLREEPPE